MGRRIDPRHHFHSPGANNSGAFTLLEVIIAAMMIALCLIPTLGTIQAARIRARSVALNLIGDNLAVAMMELIKRSGYNDIAYAQAIPAVLGSASTVNPLLDYPRRIGSSSGSVATTLPAGAPGGATDSAMATFLAAVHNGTATASSAVISSNTNYLFYSNDQIAALNGYANASAVPVGTTLLNPGFAWGVYLHVDPAGNNGGVIGYPLTHVVVIVKWTDTRRNKPNFTVLESYVSSVAPRI